MTRKENDGSGLTPPPSSFFSSVNIVATYKPGSCTWRHLTWTNATARATFERCTGIKAAVAQVEQTNLAFFVVSTFLSPLGMAFMPISAAIDALLERSCRKYVNAAPRGRREFWTFQEVFEEEQGFWAKSKRSIRQKLSVQFVQDTLLGPIYNGAWRWSCVLFW